MFAGGKIDSAMGGGKGLAQANPELDAKLRTEIAAESQAGQTPQGGENAAADKFQKKSPDIPKDLSAQQTSQRAALFGDGALASYSRKTQDAASASGAQLPAEEQQKKVEDLKKYAAEIAKTRELIKKAFNAWFRAEVKEKEFKVTSSFRSIYNFVFGGKEITDPLNSVDRGALATWREKIGRIEQSLRLAHKAIKNAEQGYAISSGISEDFLYADSTLLRFAEMERLNTPLIFEDEVELEQRRVKRFESAGNWMAALESYAALQSSYIDHTPEVVMLPYGGGRSLTYEINTLISKGIIKTSLPLVATSQDLENVKKDIEQSNLELARELGLRDGPELGDRGYINMKRVDTEIARLMSIENRKPEAYGLIENAEKSAHRIVDSHRGNSEFERRAAFFRGIGNLMNDPSFYLMILSGYASVAVGSWANARLVAMGLQGRRLEAATAAIGGVTFHDTINLGNLAIARPEHIDLSLGGHLRSIGMLWWLGRIQKWYGMKVMPRYADLMKLDPPLFKTLNLIGTKSAEVAGLASLGLGFCVGQNGFNCLTLDNIQAQFIESAQFVVAMGVAHAGRSPAKENSVECGLELAKERFLSEGERLKALRRKLLDDTSDKTSAEFAAQEKKTALAGARMFKALETFLAREAENIEQQGNMAFNRRDPNVAEIYKKARADVDSEIQRVKEFRTKVERFVDDYEPFTFARQTAGAGGSAMAPRPSSRMSLFAEPEALPKVAELPKPSHPTPPNVAQDGLAVRRRKKRQPDIVAFNHAVQDAIDNDARPGTGKVLNAASKPKRRRPHAPKVRRGKGDPVTTRPGMETPPQRVSWRALNTTMRETELRGEKLVLTGKIDGTDFSVLLDFGDDFRPSSDRIKAKVYVRIGDRKELVGDVVVADVDEIDGATITEQSSLAYFNLGDGRPTIGRSTIIGGLKVWASDLNIKRETLVPEDGRPRFTNEIALASFLRGQGVTELDIGYLIRGLREEHKRGEWQTIARRKEDSEPRSYKAGTIKKRMGRINYVIYCHVILDESVGEVAVGNETVRSNGLSGAGSADFDAASEGVAGRPLSPEDVAGLLDEALSGKRDEKGVGDDGSVRVEDRTLAPEDVAVLVEEILTKEGRRLGEIEGVSTLEEAERKFRQLKVALSGVAGIDLDRAELVEYEEPGRTVYAALIPVFPPTDHDLYLSEEEPPTFFRMQIETFRIGDPIWFDRYGNESAAPRGMTLEQEQRLFEAINRYYSRNCLLEENRVRAEMLYKLQERLRPKGFLLFSSTPNLISVIRNIDGEAFSRVSMGFPDPFRMDEKWMSQWAHYPAEVRKAILDIFPRDDIVNFIATRINSEIKDETKNRRIARRQYISFVADWNLLPNDVRTAVLEKLHPALKTAWLEMVVSQDVDDGSSGRGGSGGAAPGTTPPHGGSTTAPPAKSGPKGAAGRRPFNAKPNEKDEVAGGPTGLPKPSAPSAVDEVVPPPKSAGTEKLAPASPSFDMAARLAELAKDNPTLRSQLEEHPDPTPEQFADALADEVNQVMAVLGSYDAGMEIEAEDFPALARGRALTETVSAAKAAGVDVITLATESFRRRAGDRTAGRFETSWGKLQDVIAAEPAPAKTETPVEPAPVHPSIKIPDGPDADVPGFALNPNAGGSAIEIDHRRSVGFGRGETDHATDTTGDGLFVVRLANRRVSKQQFRIFEQDGNWWIEDLGSANGTFVNGEALERHRPRGENKPRKLDPFDVISLGSGRDETHSWTFMIRPGVNTVAELGVPPPAGQVDPLAKTAAMAKAEAPKGEEIKYKAAHAFIEGNRDNYVEADYDPEHPLNMLEMLVHPSSGDKDPVRRRGYREAVIELATAVQEQLARGEITKDKLEGMPLGPLEELPTPEAGENFDHEMGRLLGESQIDIEKLVRRFVDADDGGPVELETGAENFSDTRRQLYFAANHGGQMGKTQILVPGLIESDHVPAEPMEAGKSGWQIDKAHWIVHDSGLRKSDSPRESEYIGRFYFAVKPENAKEFWEALTREVLIPMGDAGRRLQAKISNVAERFRAGDTSVLYFHAKDEAAFRERVTAFANAHPEFFHETLPGSVAPTRPLFTAQLYDGESLDARPVRGVSFGQNPEKHGSFNTKRAYAIARAIRNERLLDITGRIDGMSPDARRALRRQLMLIELERDGVDLQNPAFEVATGTRDSGVSRFPDIHRHTDQGRPRPPSGPANSGPDGKGPQVRFDETLLGMGPMNEPPPADSAAAPVQNTTTEPLPVGTGGVPLPVLGIFAFPLGQLVMNAVQAFVRSAQKVFAGSAAETDAVVVEKPGTGIPIRPEVAGLVREARRLVSVGSEKLERTISQGKAKPLLTRIAAILRPPVGEQLPTLAEIDALEGVFYEAGWMGAGEIYGLSRRRSDVFVMMALPLEYVLAHADYILRLNPTGPVYEIGAGDGRLSAWINLILAGNDIPGIAGADPAVQSAALDLQRRLQERQAAGLKPIHVVASDIEPRSGDVVEESAGDVFENGNPEVVVVAFSEPESKIDFLAANYVAEHPGTTLIAMLGNTAGSDEFYGAVYGHVPYDYIENWKPPSIQHLEPKGLNEITGKDGGKTTLGRTRAKLTGHIESTSTYVVRAADAPPVPDIETLKLENYQPPNDDHSGTSPTNTGSVPLPVLGIFAFPLGQLVMSAVQAFVRSAQGVFASSAAKTDAVDDLPAGELTDVHGYRGTLNPDSSYFRQAYSYWYWHVGGNIRSGERSERTFFQYLTNLGVQLTAEGIVISVDRALEGAQRLSVGDSLQAQNSESDLNLLGLLKQAVEQGAKTEAKPPEIVRPTTPEEIRASNKRMLMGDMAEIKGQGVFVFNEATESSGGRSAKHAIVINAFLDAEGRIRAMGNTQRVPDEFREGTTMVSLEFAPPITMSQRAKLGINLRREVVPAGTADKIRKDFEDRVMKERMEPEYVRIMREILATTADDSRSITNALAYRLIGFAKGEGEAREISPEARQVLTSLIGTRYIPPGGMRARIVSDPRGTVATVGEVAER